MSWLVIVGLVALLALVLSGVVFVFVLRRKVESLPDGDYMVTIVDVHETPQGVATVFRVDGPKEYKGHRVTIVKEASNE